jgi:queuine tRNA-ribosyltransferase
MSVIYVPVLSTPAGRCLTAQNWQDLGVQIGAYALEELLQKPGASSFASFTSLAHYLGWHGEIVLNASSLIFDSNGEFKIKSIYDGAKFKYDANNLVDFINLLKPQVVVLPHKFYQIASYPQLDLAIKIFSDTDYNALYLETNQPALDACNGLIYASDLSNTYNLLDKTMMKNFELLDQECACPTCKQGCTRAYLYHLFNQVPLLCQRLLIQHNVYNFLRSTK